MLYYRLLDHIRTGAEMTQCQPSKPNNSLNIQYQCWIARTLNGGMYSEKLIEPGIRVVTNRPWGNWFLIDLSSWAISWRMSARPISAPCADYAFSTAVYLIPCLQLKVRKGEERYITAICHTEELVACDWTGAVMIHLHPLVATYSHTHRR